MPKIEGLSEYLEEAIDAATELSGQILQAQPGAKPTRSLIWLYEFLREYGEELGAPEAAVGLFADSEVGAAIMHAGIASGRIQPRRCETHGLYAPWEGSQCAECLAEHAEADND